MPSVQTPNTTSQPTAVWEQQMAMPVEPSAREAIQDQTDPSQQDYPLGSAKAQFMDNYIIAETAQGIVIVDQHAAHERIVYEQLKEQYAQKKVQRQILLIPEVVPLSPDQVLLIQNHASELEALGLTLDPFGEDAVSVREVPDILSSAAKLHDLIRQVADELEEQGHSDAVETRIHALLSTMACHGSVRSGRVMGQAEMNALLRQMETVPNTGQCNHGRPTAIHLNKEEIERLFARA